MYVACFGMFVPSRHTKTRFASLFIQYFQVHQRAVPKIS